MIIFTVPHKSKVQISVTDPASTEIATFTIIMNMSEINYLVIGNFFYFLSISDFILYERKTFLETEVFFLTVTLTLLQNQNSFLLCLKNKKKRANLHIREQGVP